MEIDPINGVNIYANIIVHIIVICDPFLVAGIRITKWFITSSSSLFRALILSYAMWLDLYLTRIFEKNFGKEDSSVFRVFPSNYINFRLSNFV